MQLQGFPVPDDKMSTSWYAVSLIENEPFPSEIMVVENVEKDGKKSSHTKKKTAESRRTSPKGGMDATKPFLGRTEQS